MPTAGGGRLGDAAILTLDTAALMIRPQAPRGPDPSRAVGLVWNVFRHGEPNGYAGHGGEYMWGWNQVSRRDPAAAQSYLAGLLVGDRLTTRLGITTAPSDIELAGITDRSLVAPGTAWDPVAFRTGVQDLAGTDGTLPEMIGVFRRHLPPHHAALLQRQLGIPHLGKLVRATSSHL